MVYFLNVIITEFYCAVMRGYKYYPHSGTSFGYCLVQAYVTRQKKSLHAIEREDYFINTFNRNSEFVNNYFLVM